MQTYVKTHINQGHICGRPEPAVLNSPPPLCFPQSFVFARLWHQRRLSTLCPPLTVWQLAPIKYRGQSAVSRPLIYSRSVIRSRWWWTAGMSWSWTGFTGLHYGAFSCHLTYTLDFWGRGGQRLKITKSFAGSIHVKMQYFWLFCKKWRGIQGKDMKEWKDFRYETL